MEHPAEATFYIRNSFMIMQNLGENSHVERSCTAIDSELARASAY